MHTVYFGFPLQDDLFLGEMYRIFKEISMVNRFYIIFGLICFCSITGMGQDISATITRKLSSPVTKEISEEARLNCELQLRKQFHNWIESRYGVQMDTTNSIERAVLKTLATNCFGSIKEKSSFKGNEWTFTLTLSTFVTEPAVTAHNRQCDSMALRQYRLFADAVSQNRPVEILKTGLQVLHYCKSKIGDPIMLPSTQKSMYKEVLLVVQNLLNRTTLNASDVIIDGKPGSLLRNQITATMLIDSLPVSGFEITGSLLKRDPIFAATTDKNGTITLESLTIPYVPKGAFLTISPNPGALLTQHLMTRLLDYGLLASQLNQDLIFKISPPTFHLNFIPNSTTQLKLPITFINPDFLSKFLADSCQFIVANDPSQAELTIMVQCNTTSFSHPETDLVDFVSEGKVTIGEKSTPGRREKTLDFNYKKSYGTNELVPQGLFFWETSVEIKKTIKSILASW